MIEIKTKIHDSFSIEFKEGFLVHDNANQKVRRDLFAVNTWLFFPNSLDINPQTYGKDQFYRDVKSNVRLITPVFLLRDIVGENDIPLKYLKAAMEEVAADPTSEHIDEFEYQIKMFCAIVKSSLRDEAAHIAADHSQKNIAFLCEQYLTNLRQILTTFRGLLPIIHVPTLSSQVRQYYSFGDEYLGHIASMYSFRVLEKLDKTTPSLPIREALKEFILENEAYKKKEGYPVVSENDSISNRNLVFQHGILKKFVESDLYLNVKKKKDGVAVEQLLYSIAAGLAMIFATIISFTFQKTFGSLSAPLFIALIVSYMLKDRIKELMRYFFVHRLGKKFFDNKAIVKIKEEEVGWMKEGVDFISDKRTPKEVIQLRNRSALLQAENRIFDEKIILYRKLVSIDSAKLEANNVYRIQGIHDILRLHVNRFTQKMDNPQQDLQTIAEDGSIHHVVSLKTYYINIIIQVHYDNQIEYKRFRLALTRDGIQGVEEIPTLIFSPKISI